MTGLRRNIPNALTTLRLGLALTFLFLPTSWRLTVVLIAALTDILDGFLARRFQWQSDYGRIVDPIADRCFVAALALTLLMDAHLTLAQLVWVGSRDLIVLFGSFVVVALGRRRDFDRLQARHFGKAATFLQFTLFISVLLLDQAYWSLVIITGLVSALAGIDYIRAYFHEIPKLA